MLNIIKVFLTFPLFLFFCFHLSIKIFKKRKKSFIWKEEDRYFWVKRFARYLFWLYGSKYKISNSHHWNFKGTFVFINLYHETMPLFLIKTNDFETQSPFMFLFDFDYKKQTSLLLRAYYSVINPIQIQKNIKNFEKRIVENLKHPRTVFYFFDHMKKEYLNDIINLINGAYVSTIITSVNSKNSPIDIQFETHISPQNLIKLDKKFVHKQLLK